MEIKINQVSKSFGEKKVLDNIDLEIKPGQSYFIIGKNGAGKSTLINTIIDILPKDTGDASFDGNSQLPIPKEIKKKIGILSEDAPVIEELSLRHYLEFMGRIYGLSKKESKLRIDSLIEYFFENEDIEDKTISSFSTGMKKKAGIIASVLHTPDFLILDEPFSGLDPIFCQTLISFLSKYQNGKRCMLISSHNLMYLEKFATHICILDESHVKLNCSIEDFTQGGKQHISDSLYEILSPQKQEMEALSWMD